MSERCNVVERKVSGIVDEDWFCGDRRIHDEHDFEYIFRGGEWMGDGHCLGVVPLGVVPTGNRPSEMNRPDVDDRQNPCPEGSPPRVDRSVENGTGPCHPVPWNDVDHCTTHNRPFHECESERVAKRTTEEKCKHNETHRHKLYGMGDGNGQEVIWCSGPSGKTDKGTKGP
jgi:hypothetical protein